MAKKTQLQKDYERQRKRIEKRINEYEKKGLIVQLSIPKVPKKITRASVERLRKIDIKAIRQKTKWIDLESGEIIGNYKDYAKAARQAPSISQKAIDEFEMQVSAVAFALMNRGKPYAQMLKESLRNLERQLGYTDYIKMISKSIANNTILTVEEMYDSEDAIIAGYERMLSNLNIKIDTDLLREY